MHFRIYPSTDRKEQVTYIINLILVFAGVFFLVRDYFLDFLVNNGWYPGTIRQVELIFIGVLNIVLLRFKMIKTAKWITSASMIFIFFITPIFVTMGYWDMYYINALLLPVSVVIPGMVFHAREDKGLILSLFVIALASNFACEYYIFQYKLDVLPLERELYISHSGLLSWAKLFASLFIFINITKLFRQNEEFDTTIINANAELSRSNLLIHEQNQKIEEQNLELRKNEERLKALDSAKSQFFSNVSHEFRTPLTLILTPLEKKLLVTKNEIEKAEFSVMHRNASRLLTLVNQLLDLSRLESGTLKLEMAYDDLGKFATTIGKQFGSMMDSKRIDFQIRTENVSLTFDQDKIEKVITNLLSNAFKFTGEGGTVILSVAKREPNERFTNGFVEIVVKDTGHGIPLEHLDKIFNRFYQVDGSSTRRNEGTGIGLALTKELVELHHGAISVESRPNEGAQFIVRLPLNGQLVSTNESPHSSPTLTEPIDYQETDSPENILSKSQTEKILVVEDNTDLRELIHLSLRKEYFILTASDGEEGLAVALEHVPTLIISDVMMPGRDGFQLCASIKKDRLTSHIPIILLTAKTDATAKLHGIHLGADDYMPKPFNMNELLARVRNLIENRNRVRQQYSERIELKPSEMKVQSEDDRFIKQVLEIAELHITDTSFGVEVLAAEAGMSQTQLYRKLTALTEFSPNEFIRHIRLQRAADLLQRKAGNIAEVAYQAGFHNLSYFSKSFKEKFGVSPSEYEKT